MGHPVDRQKMQNEQERSILTGMDLTVPITDGALNLGTWQGIYLYEHRSAPHRRDVVVTLMPAVG